MAVVYVVEDQEGIARGMERILSGMGHVARVFHDGLEAYAEVFERPPELLVLDVMLPSLNGLALARLVKFNEDLRHVPVLVVSAASDEVGGEATRVGVDGLLPKPFDPPALVQEVERLLAGETGGRALSQG